VAAGGGEEARRISGELGLEERPREDSRGEGDELASGAGSEEERRWRRGSGQMMGSLMGFN
jgi:hypothetical protein